MSQKNKKKNPQVLDAVLQASERQVTVTFHLEYDEKQTDFVDTLFLVSSVYKAQKQAPVAELRRSSVAETPGHVTATLLSHRFGVSLETLRDLLQLDARHTVTLHRGEVPSQAEKKNSVHEVPTGKRPSRVAANAKDKNAAKGKELPLEPKEVLGETNLSFLDVLYTPSSTYAVALPESCAGKVKRCWVELKVADSPLLDDALVAKYRPVLLSISEVRSLPSLTVAQANGVQPEHGLTALVSCLGRQLRVPLRYKSGTTEVHPAFAIVFIGDLPLLDLYRSILLDAVTVSLFHGDTTKSEEAPLPIGSGSFSIRDYVTDRQTYFDESLQLLPHRATISTSGTCLTADSTIVLNLDFGLPFPSVEHVDRTGAPAGDKDFLTQAFLLLPYAGHWVESVVARFMKELLSLPLGKEDVYLYEPPREDGDGEKAPDTKEAAAAKAGGAAAQKGEKKGKKQAQPSRPSTPPEENALSFTIPFKLVTPGGISGFEIMDRERRFICIEGSLTEVHHVVTAVVAAASCNEDLKVFLNSEIFVPKRFYRVFPPLVTPPRPYEGHSETEEEDSDLDDGGADVEAEAGGTGGRIHRICLSETLRSLSSQQRFLLHRTLSDSCLNCVRKLAELTKCGTLREVLTRQLLPSPEEVISIERSFGQTLDLTDVFARAEYVDVEALPSPSLASHRSLAGDKGVGEQEVDAGHLSPSDVGHLVSFDGIVHHNPKRRVPPRAVERFKCCMWMEMLDGTDVLCAFPRETPGTTIRYHIEGQVVSCEETLLLYVLSFHTLAKGITVSKNPLYEKMLRERHHEEESYATWVAQNAATVRNTTKKKDASTVSKGATSTLQRRPNGDSSSDEDVTDAHNPPVAEEDMDAGKLSAARHATTYANRFAGTKGTKTSEMQKQLTRPANKEEEAEEYNKLWDMYHARDPATAAAAAAAGEDASTTTKDKQKTVMHF